MNKQEYTALVDRCKQLSYEYYVLAQPTVSDAQFDALVSEIFAAIGAAAVTLALIYFFGLLGPAVFGLLAGGLLKG